MQKLRAVFLDRDGTVSEEVGYVNHIDRLRIFPWSVEAIRRLNQAGFLVILATNQSGVAQGYFPEELVNQVHDRIREELASAGAYLDAVFYCPHHPNGRLDAYRQSCPCRKPAIGMVRQALKKFPIDLPASYIVGDSIRDMEMGFNAGTKTALVMTGYGRGNLRYQRNCWPRLPDFITENLGTAAELILKNSCRLKGCP